MVSQPYTKTARELGAVLALAQGNHAQRHRVMKKARERMAILEKMNPLFNSRTFATMVAQFAFPHDAKRHPALISELLKAKI